MRGKRKIANRWKRTPYVVISQPLPAIPVYEVMSEKPHAKKTRILHKTLLLPFSYICPHANRRTPVPSSSCGSMYVPDSQPDVVDPSVPTKELDFAAEDSDGGYDASISSCSQADNDIATADAIASARGSSDKYVIPAKKKPKQSGYKLHYTSSHAPSEPSYSSRHRNRPQRVRGKPQWMNLSVWDLSQPHTFTVDRKKSRSCETGWDNGRIG